MPEPIFDETTERLYKRLPEVYRTYDIKQGWQFKKWLSGICNSQNEVDSLITRFSYTPPEDGVPTDTSDLVDPATADAAWLPWLAQLVGVVLAPADTEAERREHIGSALSGIKAGTKAAMAEAAKKVLTGTKSVAVYDHSNLTGLGVGDQWEVLVRTIQAETLSNPVDAIIAVGAKPAGVKLYHQYYGASWQTIETTYPTWAGWEGKTWQQIEETGA